MEDDSVISEEEIVEAPEGGPEDAGEARPPAGGSRSFGLALGGLALLLGVAVLVAPWLWPRESIEVPEGPEGLHNDTFEACSPGYWIETFASVEQPLLCRLLRGYPDHRASVGPGDREVLVACAAEERPRYLDTCPE